MGLSAKQATLRPSDNKGSVVEKLRTASLTGL